MYSTTPPVTRDSLILSQSFLSRQHNILLLRTVIIRRFCRQLLQVSGVNDRVLSSNCPQFAARSLKVNQNVRMSSHFCIYFTLSPRLCKVLDRMHYQFVFLQFLYPFDQSSCTAHRGGIGNVVIQCRPSNQIGVFCRAPPKRGIDDP